MYSNEYNDASASTRDPGEYLRNGFVVSIRISSTNRTQYSYTTISELSYDTIVVVDTSRGLEIGKVRSQPRTLRKEELDLPLDMVVRIATEADIKKANDNAAKAKRMYPEVLNLVRSMGLDMHIVRFEYTLDDSKAIVNYVAEQRVDFRQLLHGLSDLLRTRIEMRQIGTRDRSKMVGGLGICGLPLCCATFLGEFEGISINMAKNQLLALNIQKLSGHCGKLLCCLKFEDNDYTQLRQGLPKIGLRVMYNDNSYRIGSINVLSQMVRLDAPGDYQNLPLQQVLKLIEVGPKE